MIFYNKKKSSLAVMVFLIAGSFGLRIFINRAQVNESASMRGEGVGAIALSPENFDESIIKRRESAVVHTAFIPLSSRARGEPLFGRLYSRFALLRRRRRERQKYLRWPKEFSAAGYIPLNSRAPIWYLTG